MFEGSTVAIVTPFTDDGSAVDFNKFDELIERQIEGGTATILPCGTTGESPTLSHEEQEEVIAHTVKRVNGRVKVVAGTGSNSTAEALRLSKFAAHAGVDGLLIVTPYYNKPTPEGQYRHFKAVADAVDIPIVLYNVPGRTGTKIAPETIARLYNDVENITHVKEACGCVDQVSEILNLCDISVLSGDDALTLPMMSVGGRGVISVVANIVPAEMAALTGAMLKGDMEKAQKQHYKLLSLSKAMFTETNPISVKTALKLMGICNGVLRMPLCEMQPENEAKLAAVMKDFGLEVKGT